MNQADFEKALQDAPVSDGMSVFDHSHQSAVLLVFLRFVGCSFCESTVKELIPLRRPLEQNGVRLIFVHMASPELGQQMLEDYGMPQGLHVSDPDRTLYRAFELRQSMLKQYLSPRMWLRVFQLYFGEGIKVGKPIGDTKQMPGVFLVHEGKIDQAYRHELISDRPDYLALADCDQCTDEPAPQAAR